MVETAARRQPAVPTIAWLKRLPPALRFAFYGDAAARAALLPLWGVPCSDESLRANTNSTRASLWVGPDEYVLLDFAGHGAGGGAGAGSESSHPTSAALLDSLQHVLGALPHSLVDISHRQFALEVSGAHATTVLSGACPLDLDLAEFPVNMCTRTLLAKADILLWRTREDAFHIEVWRSFASYVTGILEEIGAELQPRG